MNKLLLSPTFSTGVLYAVAIISLHGDSAGTNASPTITAAPNALNQVPAALSAQTQAIISQAQNLTDQGQALLKSQLAQIPLQVMADAKAGNADPIKHAITQQYLKSGTAFVQEFDPGASVDKAILSDFTGYTIVGINGVILQKGVAFVEAKIVYLPSKLAEIVPDEQSKATDKQEEGSLWADIGGTGSSNICEKGGVGRATYYLVVQGGLYKLHYIYFSLNPLTPGQIKSVTASMQTLIQ